jgi:hypothetical protein
MPRFDHQCSHPSTAGWHNSPPKSSTLCCGNGAAALNWRLHATLAFASIPSPKAQWVHVRHWQGVHVHTVDPSAEAVLHLILAIFKRLPMSYEVFECEPSTGAQDVAAFLDRTVHEPLWCFVMVRVDALSTLVQQVLLKHLLASRDVVARQNLHRIQTSSTNLQAAPWIGHHQSVDLSRLLSREQARQLLRAGLLQ